MRTIFLLFLFSLLTLPYYSQDVKIQEDAVKHSEYCCVKKDYCGEKAKKCPNDNMPLIKSGKYYCTKCYISKKKPGECGRCDVVLVKMEKNN